MGWEPEKDIKLVGIGGVDAQAAALKRGEIQACIFGDGGALLEAQGVGHILMRLDEVTPKWISQILYTSEDAIKKNPETIRKALRANFRAIAFMRDDPRAAAEIIAPKLSWTTDAVLGAHKISGPLLPHDGSVSMEALASMQQTLLEYQVIKKKLPIEEHVAREFFPVRL